MSERRERPSIEETRRRLDEIVEAVSDESIDLDEAIGLYEEAVTLGLSVCELSAADVLAAAESDGGDDADEAAPPDVGAEAGGDPDASRSG